MKKQQQVQAWKFLMEQANQIQDPLLRRGMIADFRERALREWGWDPLGITFPSSTEPELDTWSKEFMEDLRISNEYGVDVRAEKHDSELDEARANMRKYVQDGGTLAGIPDNIRTPDIIELYNECKKEEFNDLMAQVDNVLPEQTETVDGPESIGDILPRVLEELKARREARNDK